MAKFTRDDKFSKRTPSRSFDDGPKRSSRDSPRFESRDSGDRFERRDSGSYEKRMHTVTCAKCGDRCEVPFRPREGKPVYCSRCFRQNDNDSSRGGDFGPKPSTLSTNEFDQINEKLNKIMKALEIE